MNCAVYCRYSSDLQSPTSVRDQLRKCREYADQQRWSVIDQHIYIDEAVSGASAERPGLTKLLANALSQSHPFDVVLTDDTSRLSRRLADSVTIFERLNFAGVRIVAVSQGIDTHSEQADVLMAVHGLVDSLYIKELGKKTHRGLEGRALQGLNTGGRCYGYVNERQPDGVRRVVCESEAAIIRRICEMYASGMSFKAIAKQLNSEQIAPPRARKGKSQCTWCPTAIRAMLRNELYIGRIVWNRSRFVKQPGTNKRVSRPRPRTEWKVVERPELQIISAGLWQCVQDRLQLVKEVFGRAGAGVNKASSSPYLLSGFLKCGACGANLTIVAGKGRKTIRKYYGCPQHFNRGACENALTIRQDVIERNFFSKLQAEVLTPQVLDYIVNEVAKQLRERDDVRFREAIVLRERTKQLEAELQNLTAAIAQAGHSVVLIEGSVSVSANLHPSNRSYPWKA